MYKNLTQFVQDEDGQSLIEYSLIAGIIAVGCIGFMYLLRNYINQLFQNIASNLHS